MAELKVAVSALDCYHLYLLFDKEEATILRLHKEIAEDI